MSIYTVHAPPPRNSVSAPDPERFVFVRDGFHFWAFLLTPLWLLWHRLWLVLLIYLIAIFAAGQAMRYAGVDPGGRFLVLLLVSLLIGLEASTLRRFTLARRGWRNVGVVGGTNAEAAERRFFDGLAAAGQGSPPASTGSPPPLLPAAPAFHTAPIVGLFPEPGAP
jgi:hypothetical protein